MEIELDTIRYLPCIRSRQAELRGFLELSPETKSNITPIISVGKLGKIANSARIAEKIREATEEPLFIDINSIPSQRCEDFEALVSPSNRFAAWRGFAESIGGVTPAVMLQDDLSQRDVVRQALQIEQDFGQVLVRSRKPVQDLATIQSILSAVDSVDNLLIVMDFGYIRVSSDEIAQAATRLISSLRSTDDTCRIAVVSSSYPRSVTTYGDRRGRLEIVERQLHERIGGDEVAIYGDHASIYPEPFQPSISRFVPRIDFPTQSHWIYERHRANDGGYVKCAKQIRGCVKEGIAPLPEWVEEDVDQFWGAQKIKETSEIDLRKNEEGRILKTDANAGFGSPQAWIAVRVNLHIEKQHLASSEEGFDYDLDDLDDLDF